MAVERAFHNMSAVHHNEVIRIGGQPDRRREVARCGAVGDDVVAAVECLPRKRDVVEQVPDEFY